MLQNYFQIYLAKFSDQIYQMYLANFLNSSAILFFSVYFSEVKDCISNFLRYRKKKFVEAKFICELIRIILCFLSFLTLASRILY